MDCCVKRETWCMSTEGLGCVGQDEVVILLETLPNEKHPPRDIFLFVNNLYKNASIGLYYNFNFILFKLHSINKICIYFRYNSY